jgi:dimethylhistidine N-methyltransferase
MTEANRHKIQATLDNVSFRNLHPATGDSRSEILAGLRKTPKTLDPKWFYDERGSQLFDQITRLPEYYPTRTEKQILQDHAQEISSYCETGCIFIEPGSGSCEKVRLLLEELRPAAYVPVDISADFLLDAAQALGESHQWLDIHAICADFNRDWSFVESLPEGKRIVFYPGSTIGNLDPPAAIEFLRKVREILDDSGGAVIGVDLHKSSEQLNNAYNDSAGVTAAFNLNILARINKLLDARFDPTSFRHHAFYNSGKRRIEMHLVSECAQTIACGETELQFDRGESIHTESSYKYTVEDFTALAAQADLALQQSWIDPERLFSVHYLAAA